MMKVTIPYDPDWPALQWAKENCPSYITNTAEVVGPVGDSKYVVHYYFSNERDVVVFSLRWT
jgi:hypothetical protein